MPKKFHKIRFNVIDKTEAELREVDTRRLTFRGVGRTRDADDQTVHFNNDEAAARYYLKQIFSRDTRAGVRGLSALDKAEAVPEMRLSKRQSQPLSNTRYLHFQQTAKSIPIFGSHITVELDQNRELLTVDGDLAEIKDISAIPTLSHNEAKQQIAELTGTSDTDLSTIQSPELTYFYNEKEDTWHLAFFFKKIPAAPKDFIASATRRKSRGHGFGKSLRQVKPLLNYLIDAHDGVVLWYYSATPMLVIPTKLKGVDAIKAKREFWGTTIKDEFLMDDPIRFIKTFDHNYQDIFDDPLPATPVTHASNDWGNTNPPAVSAHFHATQVFNFIKSVLLRDGIDDNGMDLVSIVNCTYQDYLDGKVWHNACWYNNRMYYGQFRNDQGALSSYSQYLDVIAHELTHGITEYTSNLVYSNQSGALNESFSDILGVVVKNWVDKGVDSDVANWSWEIGKGLGGGDLPLRDMSDPGRTGDPAHMDDYLHTTDDNGGVHTNSNIHNKAAYNVFTAQDEAGQRVFTSREVAILYYLCLNRLNSLATFQDVHATLIDVAKVYWAGDELERETKVKHIENAYSQVGIE